MHVFVLHTKLKWKKCLRVSLCACYGYTVFWFSVRGNWGCVWQHATEQIIPSWPPSCLGSNPTQKTLNWKLWCLVHISLMTTGKTTQLFSFANSTFFLPFLFFPFHLWTFIKCSQNSQQYFVCSVTCKVN